MKKNHDKSFKTPEGYFESFNARLQARLEEEDTSSIIPKNDGFGVPEGYFETVLPKVKETVGKQEPKVVRLHPNRNIWVVAASIAAIFILVFSIRTNTGSDVTFEDLAHTELDAYFDSNSIDLSSYELAELIDIDTEQLQTMNDVPLEDATIIEYLDEHIDDYEDLNLDYDEIDYD